MRSRGMRNTVSHEHEGQKPDRKAGRRWLNELLLTRGRRTLTARGLQYGARAFGNPQLVGASATKPNQHSGRINPEEWRNFAGHFHSFIALQALKRLDIEYSVIDFTIRAFITVNALTFINELLSHGGRPFPRAAPRELHYKIRGILPGIYG